MDESECWLRNTGRQSSIKGRWPHGGDKPSDPSQSSHSSRSGFRRESSSDSQDGSKQEQSYHTKSKTGEFYSSGAATSSKAEVPAHVRTTQSTTRPKTTPCVQEIPQPTPITVIPTPPSGEQPSTTRPYVGGKYSSTQSPAHTSSDQRSAKEHVILKSRPGHAEVSSIHLLCQHPLSPVYLSVCASPLWVLPICTPVHFIG